MNGAATTSAPTTDSDVIAQTEPTPRTAAALALPAAAHTATSAIVAGIKPRVPPRTRARAVAMSSSVARWLRSSP